jgi:lipoprotein-releasing system ATP-binding protein
VEVLTGCELSLEPGRSLAILGSSGSGKSTLLHILGTLDRPDGGELSYGGRDLLGMGSRQLAEFRGRELGFVFQFHHLLPEFSALENVGLPLLIRGMERQEAFEHARSLLDRLGLALRVEHRPDELSGGEQQRVAVARALVGGPRLILADEPTGNLDEETGRDLADLLFEYRADQGLALVLVTHDGDLASRCDRVLRLEGGLLAHRV